MEAVGEIAGWVLTRYPILGAADPGRESELRVAISNRGEDHE